MKDGTTTLGAATAILLASCAGACGSDTTPGQASAGSAGAGQSAGDPDGAGAAGSDTAVMGPSADCTFEIAMSGAQAVSYAPALLGCTTVGQQLYALFVNEAHWQTEFRAPDFKEGQTGVPLPASFQIGNPDFGGWLIDDGGCTVEVTEQVLLGPAPYASRRGVGRQYRLTGHGNCAEPAKDPTSSMPDMIPGSFSFRVRKSFYDSAG